LKRHSNKQYDRDTSTQGSLASVVRPAGKIGGTSIHSNCDATTLAQAHVYSPMRKHILRIGE
jgi:hypothetical protein